MFDITIVSQSFIYRPRTKRHPHPRNHTVEEATGFLSEEFTHSQRRHSVERSMTSRGRTTTVNPLP